MKNRNFRFVLIGLACTSVAAGFVIRDLAWNPAILITGTILVALGVLILSSLLYSSLEPTDYKERVGELEAKLKGAGESEKSQLQLELAQLEPALRFQEEMRNTRQASNALLIIAVALVAIVVGFGLSQWADGTTKSATTGDAIERLAVIGAAFYLAGQLFRRSSRLNTQASEFQRAAIAMAVTDGLADLIEGDENSKIRAEFRRAVYEHHLKGPGASASSDTESGDEDRMLQAIEAFNKLRG